jgi:hypothetical protein
MTYTDEEYDDFMEYIKVEYTPRIPLVDGDEKLRYYIRNALGAYDIDLVNDAFKILFEEPLENMPLYINHDIKIGNLGTMYLSKIAAWRLSRAK